MLHVKTDLRFCGYTGGGVTPKQACYYLRVMWGKQPSVSFEHDERFRYCSFTSLHNTPSPQSDREREKNKQKKKPSHLHRISNPIYFCRKLCTRPPPKLLEQQGRLSAFCLFFIFFELLCTKNIYVSDWRTDIRRQSRISACIQGHLHTDMLDNVDHKTFHFEPPRVFSPQVS